MLSFDVELQRKQTTQVVMLMNWFAFSFYNKSNNLCVACIQFLGKYLTDD